MIYKLSNNKVETINEHVLKEGMNWTNGEEEYEIDSTLASAPINSIVFIKKSYDGKTRTLKFEKVSTDKWDLLNKFNDRTSSYESDKSLKDKYIDGATWKLEKSVVESKSIKESSLVDKKVSTLGKRGKPMYFTAAQLKDAKAKYPEYDFEEATIDKSLPQGQKAYIAKKKTNESKSIKEDINDSDEVLTFKRDVNLAKDADEIQLLIYELSDGVAEDNVQQAFNENESNDLETLKSAVITAIDVYLEDNEWLGESKSIKESYETSSGRNITVYANYNNAKAKAKELGYIEAEYGESFGKEYSYCEWTKTGEPNVGDSIIAYYHFDENGKPKPLSKEDAEWIDQENELGGFEDFNTLKSKSTVESYYSYESARPNTREFLDLMDRYSLDTDDILRYLIADYWSDNEVGDFLDAIKSEYDLDESLKNLSEDDKMVDLFADLK